jgi:hypothetical protein
MAKTEKGKKIVPVKSHTSDKPGKARGKVRVKRHHRSTPN